MKALSTIKQIALIAVILFSAARAVNAEDAADLSSESGGSSGFADDKVSIYGYATSLVSIDFRELPSKEAELGAIAYIRVKGDFKPQEGLSFHIEASSDTRVGYQNQFVQLADSGLATPGSSGFISSIAVDQAYGSIVKGAFSLQAGLVPIGWGSAYVFNPTQRSSRPALLDIVADETPGTLAIVPAWSPSDSFRLSAYAAFQDKSHRETVAAGDGLVENMPFGMRAQTTIGNFDFSACLIKEVDYIENPLLGTADYARALFAGIDAAGAVWEFGVYAEAALKLPMGADGLTWTPELFDFIDSLELAAGFDYTIPGIEVELRMEYYRCGWGCEDKAAYNPLSLLSGAAILQAKDYLFARLERVFADYFTVDAGALVNLNDTSAVAMTELSYSAMDNLEFKLGGVLPFGPEGSEFEGRYDLSGLGLGLGVIDVMRSSMYMSCKLSF
jgi:hypothetical protein